MTTMKETEAEDKVVNSPLIGELYEGEHFDQKNPDMKYGILKTLHKKED